jgi:DNA polymerase eta
LKFAEAESLKLAHNICTFNLDQGTILRYFSGCSSSNQGSANNIDGDEQERKASSSASELSPNPKSNNVKSRYWGLDMEEIDPSVVDELPLEIQREIMCWIHPSKRINTAQRGSTISHYFSPARK